MFSTIVDPVSHLIFSYLPFPYYLEVVGNHYDSGQHCFLTHLKKNLIKNPLNSFSIQGQNDVLLFEFLNLSRIHKLVYYFKHPTKDDNKLLNVVL